MSTEGFPAVRRFAGLALGFAVLAPPAIAAQVDFRPVLTFGLYHSGNVQIIGDNAIGDETAAIAVDLAVDRNTSADTLSFLYRATYMGYRQNSGLNFLGNLVSLRYEKELSRRSSLYTSVEVLRTDTQGIAGASVDPEGTAASNVDRPLTFVPRTTITRGYGAASGTVGVSPRGLVDWSVGAGVNRYDEVEGVVFNNSTSAQVGSGWRYELSERSTLGFAVRVDWFGYEVTEDSVTETVALTGTHELGRFTAMTYDVGATRTTTAGQSSTSGAFLARFSRELTKDSSLDAGVRQSVTPGTGLQGATTDSGAWISYAQSSPRHGLYGVLDGAYWLRRTIQTDNTPGMKTETLNLAGALGWRFNRFVSLSVAYAQYFQKDRSDSSSPLDTRYASYGLFLRWAIRGLGEAPDLGGSTPRGM